MTGRRGAAPGFPPGVLTAVLLHAAFATGTPPSSTRAEQTAAEQDHRRGLGRGRGRWRNRQAPSVVGRPATTGFVNRTSGDAICPGTQGQPRCEHHHGAGAEQIDQLLGKDGGHKNGVAIVQCKSDVASGSAPRSHKCEGDVCDYHAGWNRKREGITINIGKEVRQGLLAPARSG